MFCGNSVTEMGVVEGFRAILCSSTLSGLCVLEVFADCLCLEIDSLLINWEYGSASFVSQK